MKNIKLEIKTLLESKVVDVSKLKVIAPRGTKNTLHVHFLNAVGDGKIVYKHLSKLGYEVSEMKYDRTKKSNYYLITV